MADQFSATGTLSRRDLIKGTVFFGATALAGPVLASSAPGLPFLILGDWGRAGGFHQADVAAQMGRTASEIGSRFTVSVGDNFYEDGVASVGDAKWRTDFEDIYTAASLQTPWRAILGNHDYRGDPQAQLDYSRVSHRWRMPARYWTETLILPDGGAAAFFFTDTSPFLERYWGSAKVRVDGQDRAAQLAWLNAQLARSKADWKIVYGHHPLFTDSKSGEGEGGRDIPELIAQFKPLFDRHGVHAYVNGHDHNLQHLVVDGVSYVCSGAGSKTSPVAPTGRCRFASDHPGFIAAKLSSSVLELQFVDYQGTVLGATSVRRG